LAVRKAGPESEFNCVRCGRDDPQPLAAAPFADERGARILGEVCSECWEEWKKQQMLLINHYGLNVREKKAREFLYKNLDAFLFGAGDAAKIDTSQEGTVDW
jgi:Fe-S cluster biosynthesis and repair protein YggX